MMRSDDQSVQQAIELTRAKFGGAEDAEEIVLRVAGAIAEVLTPKRSMGQPHVLDSLKPAIVAQLRGVPRRRRAKVLAQGLINAGYHKWLEANGHDIRQLEPRSIGVWLARNIVDHETETGTETSDSKTVQSARRATPAAPVRPLREPAAQSPVSADPSRDPSREPDSSWNLSDQLARYFRDTLTDQERALVRRIEDPKERTETILFYRQDRLSKEESAQRIAERNARLDAAAAFGEIAYKS